MEQEKEMLESGNPEFEVRQMEEQMKGWESDVITYSLGGYLTIVCCG